MAMQMIFCVETNKRANTDSVYISDTLSCFYDKSNKIKLSTVYMGTKSKYKSKEVLKEIDRKIKDFLIGKTNVIYCVDTDSYEKNAMHEQELNSIMQFCEEKDYDLIWFCHDIEEVFLGKKVSDSQKVQEAADFRKKNKIKEIPIENLSVSEKRANSSNILCVLDKYLQRKQ